MPINQARRAHLFRPRRHQLAPTRKRSSPSSSPSASASSKYDLTKLVFNLSGAKKKAVGLLSTLPLEGAVPRAPPAERSLGHLHPDAAVLRHAPGRPRRRRDPGGYRRAGARPSPEPAGQDALRHRPVRVARRPGPRVRRSARRRRALAPQHGAADRRDRLQPQEALRCLGRRDGRRQGRGRSAVRPACECRHGHARAGDRLCALAQSARHRSQSQRRADGGDDQHPDGECGHPQAQGRRHNDLHAADPDQRSSDADRRRRHKDGARPGRALQQLQARKHALHPRRARRRQGEVRLPRRQTARAQARGRRAAEGPAGRDAACPHAAGRTGARGIGQTRSIS